MSELNETAMGQTDRIDDRRSGLVGRMREKMQQEKKRRIVIISMFSLLNRLHLNDAKLNDAHFRFIFDWLIGWYLSWVFKKRNAFKGTTC